MPRNLTRALQASSFLLVMSGYLALMTTQRYSAALTFVPLFFYAIAPLGEYLDAKFSWYRRVTAVVSISSLAAALASLAVLDLLASVTLLVIYIQAYTLLHRKRVSSYHHLHLMAFFLLLAAFVQNPEPEIGPIIALFVSSAIGALMALHAYTELERNEGIGLGEIVPLAAHDTDMPMLDTPRHAKGVATVFTAIVLAVSVFMAGIFYLTPRMEAGLLGRGDPALFRTGPSRTVDLAKSGNIQRSQIPVMHVEFPDEPGGRYSGETYWRTTALHDYQKGRWQSKGVSHIRTQPAYSVPISAIVANASRRDGVARDPWNGARVVHQSIYMDDAPEDGLPCLTMVQRVNNRTIRLGWSERGDYSVVVLRHASQHWIQYDAWSDIQRFTPEQLRNAPDNYREILSDQDLRDLTSQDLLPRTRRLAQTITRNARTVFDKATALNTYLSGSNYSYTLNLPPLPADHPIDEFINETRRGHCELYASALALMLRAIDVPTRVVAGYRGGDWSEADRAYTVRADMAHLWAEVYFLGCGWVTFDPSPRERENLLARNWLARTVSRYVLRAKIFWYRDVIGFDRALQLALFRNVSLGLIGLGSEWIGSVDSTRIIGPRSPWPPLALIAAMLAGFLAWRRRSRATSSRSLYAHVLTTDQVRAVRLYRDLRHRLERIGVPVVGRTAEEIRRALEETPILAETTAVHDIIETYNQVRFGGRPFSRDHYARLKRLQRSLQRNKQ